MSESESEADGPTNAVAADLGGTRYPLEGKFISARDKANIMAMPEARREQILSERMEEVEKENFSRQLLQRREAEQKAAEAADRKKRKAASTELDDSPRRASRQKTAANDTLANYKKKREQMNEARRSGVDRRDRNKQSPSRLFDHSSGPESDNELEDRRGPAAAPPKKEPEPTLRDFEHVRVGRTGFSQICFTPGFEIKMPGCFARANIGPNHHGGTNIYRMVQIKEVIVGKPYMMEGRSGRPFHTDQYIRTASGKSEKTFNLAACSDSPFTAEEFDRFKRDQAKDGLKLPTLSILNATNDGIHALINHHWTSEEINAKIERSGKRKEQMNRPLRAQLASERKQAMALGDNERVAKIDAELEELGAPKVALVNSNANRQPTGLNAGKSQSQADRIARMNEANRKAEMEHRRKVQLAEKRRERAAAEKGIVDPFARVKTTAIIHHDSAAYDSGRSKTGTPEPSFRPNGTAANGAKGPSGDTLQVPGADKSIDDLFSEGSDRSRAVTPARSINGSSKAGTPTPSQEKSASAITVKKKKKVDDVLPDIELDVDL